ncbi:MAG: TonB-dependent receptor [Rhodanobacteraceae bacterium]|jgi:outer membrane receptor protein involved in Fe transport|nr:MAG: TonB-dependent receptor [Rhodanobacteraceae bacterium]
MFKPITRCFLILACLLPMLAFAQQRTASDIDIPAGNLVTALDTLARQTGVQFVYSADQLAGLTTRGARGKLSAEQALANLLAGTGYTARRDDSGAMVIVKSQAKPAAPATSEPPAQSFEAAPKTLQEVVVTGSRIPRTQIEGPAPVVAITAQDIQRRGFANVPDLMTSLPQNLGALDNNQYTDGFSPGAQAVDLRGLGPNHTLVLVNGRRIADFPQAYGGNSNFTDISNLPTSLIDRVEILSGSASAVYGSDAISGVINFILKKKADGTTIDYRAGGTQHGGGGSQRLDITTGFSKGKFDAIFGLELVDKHPLWAFQRSYTDSRLDSPAPPSRIYPDPVWGRLDVDENYIDPGQATCDALAGYDKGTIIYGYRRNWGNYCGSYYDYAYATLENGRKMANFFGSATYHFNGYTDLYLDVLAGFSHQDSYNSPLKWMNCEPLNGDCTDTPFYNTATGQVEEWQRQFFTIEENGGFKPGFIRNIGHSISLNTGIKGTLGADSNWNYEANFEHSQNKVLEKWPALIAAKAQALYLGPSLGVDPDSGYQMYYAPISRLYTPLTVAQFRSITQDSIDHDKARAENWSLTVTNTDLFKLPAGPVGFAGIAEYGNQYFGQIADPMSLDGSYYGLHNTTSVGSRSHAAVGYEFSVPVFSKLTVTTAGRYDRYSFSDNSTGKFTYALGLEYRPVESLLLRGSYSTGFRAPDLSYLYAGMSGSSSGGTDYYLCRLLEPDTGPDYADNCSNGDVGFNGRSHGSTALKDETSKSLTYGFVWAPTPNFDVSADYYRIKLSNEVEYQSSDDILRREADCRLGVDVNGNPVNGNSAYCQQIESQVVRNPANAPYNPNGITSVLVLPINAAIDQTSGVDVNAHYRLDAQRFGTFDFNFGATYVIMHTTQLSPDSPVDNEMTDIYYYLIPRTKANASVTWNFRDFTTTLYGARLGGIPNYDGTQRMGPTFLYNLTMGYKVAPGINVSLIVDNLFDSRPPRDTTWTSWPYYSRNWFNAIGRAYFVDLSVKLGGTRQ